MSKNLLKGLTLVEAPERGSKDPAENRRMKLISRLEEQKALLADRNYQRMERKRRDGELVEVPKRVKPWWVTRGDGSVVLGVRHGGSILELAPGKYAVAAQTVTQLPSVLDTLISATGAGELDAALEAATRAKSVPRKASAPRSAPRSTARASVHAG
jgi:uncharacterized protein DUF6641